MEREDGRDEVGWRCRVGGGGSADGYGQGCSADDDGEASEWRRVREQVSQLRNGVLEERDRTGEPVYGSLREGTRLQVAELSGVLQSPLSTLRCFRQGVYR